MIRLGCAIAVTGLVALTATACGGGSGGSGTGSGTASAKPKILTGTRLAGLLLPAADMPKGFALDPDATRNSMDAIEDRSTAPVPADKVCEMFVQTSSISAAGIGSATFAQSDYADHGHTQEIAQEIDFFHPGDAQKVMAELRKALARCASFTYKQSGMTVKTKIVTTAIPGVADDGLKAVSTSPIFQGGGTLAAIRTGDAVVTVLYSSRHSDKGTAAVTWAKRIADGVRSAV